MKNLRFKFTYILLLSFISLLFFVIVAALIGRDRLVPFDHAVASMVQGLESPFLTVIMKLFTFIGSTPIVIVLSIITLIFLYKILHHRLELVFFIVVLSGSGILNLLLKSAFHRQRPSLHRLIQATGYSFPSGHSMQAFTLYAALTFLLWKHVPSRAGRTWTVLLCVIMILLIGISRIYLGVHYPSDVIGAYFASGCWFALSVWCFQWYKEHRYQQKIRK